MNILAVICARGGSKGLPLKNLATLSGKPLLAWSIDAATGARVTNRVVLSTEDAEIAAIGRRYGADVPFMRPAELATDQASGLSAVLHAVSWLDEHEGYRPDIVIHLQPTSPLRTSDDIDCAVAFMDERRADAVVSVCPVKHHPYWMKTIDDKGWMHDFVPQAAPTMSRQELPPVYAVNGAIYLARTPYLLANSGWFGPRTAPFIMPADRSIDIDTELDLAMAAHLMGASK